MFHDVASLGPPEQRVGGEELVYVGRQQSPVRLTNKGETDPDRFFWGRLAGLGSLPSLGLMVILVDLVRHALQDSFPGGGGGLLYRAVCQLVVPHRRKGIDFIFFPLYRPYVRGVGVLDSRYL